MRLVLVLVIAVALVVVVGMLRSEEVVPVDWAPSTTTGEWRQITDCGERATFIARRVCWSSDGRAILAAIDEGDSDIVMLEGLTNVGRE